MNMPREVDYDYEFEHDSNGFPLSPKGLTKEGNLYVLPNGKYLPSGAYADVDGSGIIYEPHELSPFAEMLKEVHERENKAR